MNSINKNQEENNTAHLQGSAAIDKIKDLVNTSKTCFFCTEPSSFGSQGTRPMTVQEVDEQGSVWFLSAKDSHTNKDILADRQVKLYFQGSEHSDFLYLEGPAFISEDKEKIEKFWSPLLKVWFTEGIDDPRISLIEVRPDSGYYWDNKHGNTIAGLKMLIGAAIGKTMDDSIEGNLSV